MPKASGNHLLGSLTSVARLTAPRSLPSMNGFGPFIVIIVAAVLLALLGLVLVRRTVPYDRLAQHTDVVGYVYAVIGVIYAVILAQVVIAASQEYQDARTVADDEANLDPGPGDGKPGDIGRPPLAAGVPARLVV